MGNYVSVILCRVCGSRYVEIQEWDDGKAVFFCRTCGAHEQTDKFTLGRCSVTNSELMNARDTAARKGNYEL